MPSKDDETKPNKGEVQVQLLQSNVSNASQKEVKWLYQTRTYASERENKFLKIGSFDCLVNN